MMPTKQTYMFQINILLFVSLISISKKISSQIPFDLEDNENYKISDLIDHAHFQAFLLQSNGLMNTYIQKIKIRYQCQQIPKIIKYSKLISQVQRTALKIPEMAQLMQRRDHNKTRVKDLPACKRLFIY